MTPTALTASTFVSCLADLNTDGSVNGLDLCILLAKGTR